MSGSVLIMNKGWAPIEVWSLFKAVKAVYKGKAKIVDRECNMYDWDRWVEHWSDAKKISEYSFRPLHSSNFVIAKPEVIILNDYNGYIFKNVKLNRRNVYTRDHGTCQYCGKKEEDYTKLNIDHIIPQGQGGKTTWKNIALSCFSCNQEKGCRTPEEANMKLLRNPFTPRWYHMDKKLSKTLKNWEQLFTDMYWNVELEK